MSAPPSPPAAARLRADDASMLERIESFDAVEPEAWNELALAAGNVFGTREWLSTWWRHFGAGKTLALRGCRDADGRLVAILPLYVSSVGPLRVVRFVGHEMGNEAGPVCAPADRPAAARALRAALAELRWDVFLGEKLRPGDGWASLLGGAVTTRSPSPVLRLAPTFDEYLATCSSNFRQQLRRKERKLLREHGAAYRFADDRDRLGRDLETLFALHEERFSGGTSTYTTGPRKAFQRDFALLASQRGWLRLWFLEVEGSPVAAWCGFRFGDSDTYYQAGRDRDWDGASVGVVLIGHSIRDAIEAGVSEYRLGPGGSAYKYRFTSDDPELETVALTRTLRGRLALSCGDALRRSAPLKTALKRRLAP